MQENADADSPDGSGFRIRRAGEYIRESLLDVCKSAQCGWAPRYLKAYIYKTKALMHWHWTELIVTTRGAMPPFQVSE